MLAIDFGRGDGPCPLSESTSPLVATALYSRVFYRLCPMVSINVVYFGSPWDTLAGVCLWGPGDRASDTRSKARVRWPQKKRRKIIYSTAEQ